MVKRGLLSLRHTEMFDTQKDSSEMRNKHFRECIRTFYKCLKLNIPRFKATDYCSKNIFFLRHGLLRFMPRQLANQMAGFQ